MKHLAVIGGGFGGIAAALRARAKGYDVTMIDRCSQLGGRAQTFERNGFRHDAGPTVITAPFLFDELFELFEKKRSDYVTFKPLPVWYRFQFDDGFIFDYGGNATGADTLTAHEPNSAVSQTLKRIAEFAPEDVEGYQALVKHSQRIYQLGFEELADKPFHSIIQMVKQIPAMMSLGSYRTVWQFVCRYLSNPYLRQAFSIQPLLVGGNPFDTTSIYNLIHYLELRHGIFFAMGGTGALVEALKKLMIEEGINIHLNATVTNIKTHQTNNRVESVAWTTPDNKQHELTVDGIISNTDPSHLYDTLLHKSAVNTSAKIKSNLCKRSMGLFVLYFGTRKTYPDIEHHTILMGPRYKELLDDIFNKKIISNDFSIYLHRPTATDPSFAPEGCDSFYALVPVPNLDGGQDWQVEGPKLQQRVLEYLQKKCLPDLDQVIDSPFFMTPEDFRHDYLSTAGAGFSIAPLFNQSAWFRYHNQAEGPENLWLVGAGSHPGAGLPGVVSSAKVVESLLPNITKAETGVSDKSYPSFKKTKETPTTEPSI